MAYDNPYQLLRPDVTHYLSEPENYEARAVLIDCLALLQDLLGRFSSGPIISAFDNAETISTSIDQYLSKMSGLIKIPASVSTTSGSAASLQGRANEVRDYVIDVLRTNKRTALDLYHECVSPKSAFSRETALSLVDQYLNILASHYETIRLPQSKPLTQSAQR